MDANAPRPPQHRCEHPQCGREASHIVSSDGRGRTLCERHVASYKKTGAFVLPLRPAGAGNERS